MVVVVEVVEVVEVVDVLVVVASAVVTGVVVDVTSVGADVEVAVSTNDDVDAVLQFEERAQPQFDARPIA